MSGIGQRAVEIYCSDKTASGEEKKYKETRRLLLIGLKELIQYANSSL